MQSAIHRHRNRLLTAFPPEALLRLADDMETVPLRRRTVVTAAGVPTPHLYFPERGLVSLIKTMADGRMAEVGVVGPEGMVGISTALGITSPEIDAVVQIDGTAYRIPASAIRAEAERTPSVRNLLLQCISRRLSQLAQTAACNRLHTLRQRCRRWLLTAHDCAQAPTFTLTHEFLALMMGVNRPTLSLTLKELQEAGIIEYRYAAITIINRQLLEESACECYVSLRQDFDLTYKI